MERNDFVIETFGLSYKSGVLKVVDLNKFMFYTRPFEYEEGVNEILVAGNIIKLNKFIAKLLWLHDRKFVISEIGKNFVKTVSGVVFLTETPEKVAEILSLAKEPYWLKNIEDKNIVLPLIEATIFKVDGNNIEIGYLDYLYGCEQKKFKFNKFKSYILKGGENG